MLILLLLFKTFISFNGIGGKPDETDMHVQSFFFFFLLEHILIFSLWINPRNTKMFSQSKQMNTTLDKWIPLFSLIHVF